MKKVLPFVIGLVLLAPTVWIAALVAAALPPDPSPLLKDVRAGGGWWGACPPEGDGRRPLAISPELDQRLREQFSSGTPEQHLIAALSEQGFKRVASCANDPTIHQMEFYRGQVRAAAYWKSDDAANIVWTKGFVFYISW
jgi:hypothetical protein